MYLLSLDGLCALLDPGRKDEFAPSFEVSDDAVHALVEAADLLALQVLRDAFDGVRETGEEEICSALTSNVRSSEELLMSFVSCPSSS
jgi:hypothetical protein